MSNKKSTNNIINPYKKSDMFQINDQPTFNNYTMNNDNTDANATHKTNAKNKHMSNHTNSDNTNATLPNA